MKDKHISRELSVLQNKQQISDNSNIYNDGYSIQISSWESEAPALKQKNKLLEIIR